MNTLTNVLHEKIDHSVNRLRLFALGVFPVLMVVFAIMYFADPDFYYNITLEDNLVEWLTFGGLFISGIISMFTAIKIKIKFNYTHWFFVLFSLFNFLAGFEEISWGQRIFQYESGEFFTTYNDQQETNLHNTFQGMVGLKTKHIALIVLFIYGVVFPYLITKNKLRYKVITEKKFIVPPTFLIPGFLLSTILMIDKPTGNEEELGEFFYSLCFLIFTLFFYFLSRSNYFHPQNKNLSATEH